MNLLNHIEEKNILVIGDVMLDTYYVGDVKRISPEAPVPVFKKQSEHSVLGGAANVAANLIAAGQNVFMMTIIGEDDSGKKIKKMLMEKGIDVSLVFTVNRNTTEKNRFIANNHQQVLRLDIEDTKELDSENYEKFLCALKQKIDIVDLVLLSDYLKGLLSYEFTHQLVEMAKHKNIPVIIDVKDSMVEKYKDAYLIKPNLKELHDLTGMSTANDNQIIEASEYLRRLCNCKYVLTTCGARGMVLVGDKEPYFIESVGQEVFDVTGAGDTTIAYLAACMVNGCSIREAVEWSNIAAGIQVSKVGTSSVYWREIREYLANHAKRNTHKLITRKTAKDLRKNNQDKTIVFTNGCFDILHIGHIRYLQEAAKLGDILVVGLNSDESVKRLKGSERPINNELDRAEFLCVLGFVDYVVIFEEDTPLELIKELQPDILVKGGDYRNKYVVGTNEVKHYGGQFVLIPFTEGKSTTNIIDKILK